MRLETYGRWGDSKSGLVLDGMESGHNSVSYICFPLEFGGAITVGRYCVIVGATVGKSGGALVCHLRHRRSCYYIWQYPSRFGIISSLDIAMSVGPLRLKFDRLMNMNTIVSNTAHLPSFPLLKRSDPIWGQRLTVYLADAD